MAETHPATRSDYAGPGITIVAAGAATNYVAPLVRERLHAWHRRLFPGAQRIAVGRWRDDRHGPMRVVSGGPVGRNQVVHFEVPPADRLEHEMQRFLDLLKQPEPEPDFLKAAVAHLRFVTIHPYDDGNGRIGRAITDLVLARCDGTPLRFYSMSGEIMRRRAEYYSALQVTQSGSMDVAPWTVWFLECLTSAMSDAEKTAAAALSYTKLRPCAQDNGLNDREVKFVSRLIDGWMGNVTPWNPSLPHNP